MHDNNYTNYGLRRNVPPQNTALTSFENGIYNIIRNIEFRNVHGDFQERLREGKQNIPPKTYLFLQTSEQIFANYQAQITTDF